MSSIDVLLNGLKRNDPAMYERLGTMCRAAYEQAGLDFRRQRKLPNHAHYHSGVSYTLALQQYYSELSEVQCNAFFKCMRNNSELPSIRFPLGHYGK